MDAARRKEEVANRKKAEEAFQGAHSLVREGIQNYHSDWAQVFASFKEAKVKAEAARDCWIKAGMTSIKVASLTPGLRRAHARDVTDFMKHEELQFLNEPRLPAVIMHDFLDRVAPSVELIFRIEAEGVKAKHRFDGDRSAGYAKKMMDQGIRDQETGLFASANQHFASAEKAIVEAADKYSSVGVSDQALHAKWADACNNTEENPMLTQDKKLELEEGLRHREIYEVYGSQRAWDPIHGFDKPSLYALNSLKVGMTYSEICKGVVFDHSPDGLKSDGSDTESIVERLEQALRDALKAQKEDMAFKALALCAVDELKAAQEAILAAAKQDIDSGEHAASEHVARIETPAPIPVSTWTDLPDDKLGPVAMTDEVRELHTAAAHGDSDRLRELLEEVEEQHYYKVDSKNRKHRTALQEAIFVDALDFDAKSPLFKCAKDNQHDAARVLLDLGAHVNRQDINGTTPLHIAASNGAAEMVKLLLEYKADAELANMQKETPLHHAARYSLGDIDIARSLAATGADMNAVDVLNQTVLHFLVKNRRYGNKELYMLNFFLVCGADADARDSNGFTPLDLCDDPEARKLLRDAFSGQGALREARWGPSGHPPQPDVPLSLHEQAMQITLGEPLVCVIHKGKKAFINREECRACRIGVVVTVPFRGSSDFAHMCCNCGVKEVSNHWIRSGHFV